MLKLAEFKGKRLPFKPMLIAGGWLLILYLFLLISSRLFFLSSYERMEEQSVVRNVKRVLSALANEKASLNTVVGDYAGWDASCDFVENRNPDYIRTNLSDAIYPKLRVNVIVFTDRSGRIVYEREVDWQKREHRQALVDLRPFVAESGPLVRHGNPESIHEGIIVLADEPLLVVSRPILTSDYKGPVRGALLMGRFLDSDEESRIAALTHLSVSLTTVNDSRMSPDVRDFLAAERGDSGVEIKRFGSETVAGYTLINDINGKPALVVKVLIPRQLYGQGVTSIRWYIVTSMVVGLIATVLGCILYLKLLNAHDELEQRVAERTAELREKDRILMLQSRQAAMGEMIGNIAHQWRQPLNSLGCIVQSLPMLHESGDLDRPALESTAEKVMDIILHMSHTIDDFRNYFKPDREKVPFNVYRAVSRTVSFIEDSFRSLGISVRVQAAGNAVIDGYPNEYSQVLLNILINSRDALLERNIPHPRIVVTIGAENGRSVVTIEDNAGGIPDDVIEKIFDPYFTTKGPDKGTGVGLFMSKGIIEKNMGGTITVRNTEQGAEFTVKV